jgi:C4-type Zn-finger protein
MIRSATGLTACSAVITTVEGVVHAVHEDLSVLIPKIVFETDLPTTCTRVGG